MDTSGGSSNKTVSTCSIDAEPGSHQPILSFTTAKMTTPKGQTEDVIRELGPEMGSTESSCSRRNASRRGKNGSRENSNQNQEYSSLMPANIRHKYGKSVVDQLISPEQVRYVLKKSEEDAQNPQEYRIPQFVIKPWLMENNHEVYNELGHCLRANLFPGAPTKSSSLVKDSYTAEINKKGLLVLDKSNARYWHGKKTDELGTWFQTLMERSIIAKELDSLPRPTLNLSYQPRVSIKIPPPPPPQLPTKPEKRRHQNKNGRPKIQSSPLVEIRQEEDFWDFYDKPIL